jgi:hypothetical protein
MDAMPDIPPSLHHEIHGRLQLTVVEVEAAAGIKDRAPVYTSTQKGGIPASAAFGAASAKRTSRGPSQPTVVIRRPWMWGANTRPT